MTNFTNASDAINFLCDTIQLGYYCQVIVLIAQYMCEIDVCNGKSEMVQINLHYSKLLFYYIYIYFIYGV